MRGTQDPVPKGYVGSNPTPRTTMLKIAGGSVRLMSRAQPGANRICHHSVHFQPLVGKAFLISVYCAYDNALRKPICLPESPKRTHKGPSVFHASLSSEFLSSLRACRGSETCTSDPWGYHPIIPANSLLFLRLNYSFQ